MVVFELLGYINPMDEFPSPLIPVGRLDGELVLVYASRRGLNITEKAVGSLEFTGLPRDTGNFDYQRELLFGVSETEILRYRIDDEVNFFRSIITRAGFCETYPFTALGLAFTAGEHEIYNKLLRHCFLCLREGNAEIAEAWLRNQVAEAQKFGIPVREGITLDL